MATPAAAAAAATTTAATTTTAAAATTAAATTTAAAAAAAATPSPVSTQFFREEWLWFFQSIVIQVCEVDNVFTSAARWLFLNRK